MEKDVEGSREKKRDFFPLPSPFLCLLHRIIDVVVNFLSRVIFVFLLFLDMVMYANEVETKEK